jgi:hypothetical protein
LIKLNAADVAEFKLYDENSRASGIQDQIGNVAVDPPSALKGIAKSTD